jgi:hypothetical protein
MGASAELFKNLKADGQLDVMAVSARNVEDFATRPAPSGTPNNQDRLGHGISRLMVSVATDPLDDVHAKVTLVKGASNLTGATAQPRTFGSGSENLDTWQNSTWVQQAFVKIDKVFGALDTTIGRQFYGEPGDLIAYFGPKTNYGFVTTSLDAGRFDWNGEHMMATGIVGKTADTAANTVGGTATDLRGIVLSCKMHENVKPTVYVYNSLTHAAGGIGSGGTPGGANTNLYVVGAKVKVKAGPAWVNGEFARNFGEDRTTVGQSANYKGWAFMAKGGVKLETGAAMIAPWAELGVGSGDSRNLDNRNETFQSIATDYRPGAIYGRFDATSAAVLGSGVAGFTGSSNGLSNRTVWGAGVKATPGAINKLTVGAQFYRYAFTRIATNPNSSVGVSRNIGSEIDVTGEWKHSENVSLKGTLGSFQPGRNIADVKGANASLNPAVMAAADISVKFGG